MPTRSRPVRLNSLPQLQQELHHAQEKDLGISIKGSDILKTVVKKPHTTPPRPPSTPRGAYIDVESRPPSRPPSSPHYEPRIRHVEDATWRPASAVRRLGDVALPTVEESTADILEKTRSSRLLRRESSQVDSIKNIFAGIMSGELSPNPCLLPETRSVACSPLSSWSCMSEDLLEHVSQRIATQQQMSAPSRSGSGAARSRPVSALATSRPGSRVSLRDHIVSPHSLSALAVTKPASQKASDNSRATSARLNSSSNRKRPLSGRPGSSRSGRSAGSVQVQGRTPQGRTPPPSSRPSTAMSSAVLSYRDSLSETGISLPPKAVERLVSSYERVKSSSAAGSRSCSRMSDVRSASSASTSSPLYLLLRQKIHQGYRDMVEAFEVYDRSKDGVLTREDFSRVLEHFTIGLTKKQIYTLLNRSDLVGEWENDRVPYKTFLRKYLQRGHSGYIRHCADLDTARPQTGDTGLADLAEARLIAQLHSDFVDVLENFRSHDKEDSGCVAYADFKDVMSEYGLAVPEYRDEDRVNYVDYLNSVAQMPAVAVPDPQSRPQTAPAKMALTHAYTNEEEDTDMQFQQLSLNLRPVHKDPRTKALVKLENCKILKGGTRRPRQQGTNIQGQIARKFGGNNKELRRVMQYYDTSRDGHIAIGTFRDLLSDFNIKVDENEFYNVVNTYDTSFRGLLPYKKILNSPPVNA